MNQVTIVLLILGVYLALTFLTSLIGKKQDANTPEGYFLAGRNIKTITLFFTLIATNFSAFFFLGFAGEGYRIGYGYYAMIAMGTAFAALSFYFVGFKTWTLGKEKGYITQVQMVQDLSKSPFLAQVFLWVSIVFTLPYLAIQPIGAGYILSNLTNGQVPYFAGAVGLTLFIMVYVWIGGMRSVANTDVKQGILMILLMGAAFWVVAQSYGGIEAANEKAKALQPDLFTLGGKGNYFTPQKWISFMVLWLMCVPMFPQLFMRFFISKDLPSFKTATILYALIPSLLFIFPIAIGVWGHLDLPGLVGKEADQILPRILIGKSAYWFAALVMVGALAAFMSTLDSQLLAIGTLFTRDFYVPLLEPMADLPRQVTLGKIAIGVFALLGLAIAYHPFDTIFDIAKMAFSGYALLFIPTICVLYVPWVHPKACGIAILASEIVLVGMYFVWIPKAWLLGFEPILPLAVMETVLIVSITAFLAKKKEAIAQPPYR